ncbi:hypothetical protein TKV_c15560 [Thermoanaerobacter kivui]|uniref:Uncharacterized protein n=1 Tax=Thermoanaerobacter kivui TaxID=2325 RepID=A0A097ASC5_THEKI|nr:hypothetical protein [Thermoanaerobacter kivui]AIS52721.1 hypothetical protein TKV_c15560 [Thermoanaerobacter kivui]
MRVKVHDTATNKLKVNIAIPYNPVKFGLKLGMKFIPSELINAEVNTEEILEAIKTGGRGKNS